MVKKRNAGRVNYVKSICRKYHLNAKSEYQKYYLSLFLIRIMVKYVMFYVYKWYTVYVKTYIILKICSKCVTYSVLHHPILYIKICNIYNCYIVFAGRINLLPVVSGFDGSARIMFIITVLYIYRFYIKSIRYKSVT